MAQFFHLDYKKDCRWNPNSPDALCTVRGGIAMQRYVAEALLSVKKDTAALDRIRQASLNAIQGNLKQREGSR